MMDRADSPLGRYARIMETLAASPEGMTLTQIAEAVQLQAGTAHRLINSLCAVGFAARHNGQKTYVLGPRMVRLCHLALTPPSFIAMAEPVLHELVKKHGETAYLAKLSGTVVESVAMDVPRGGDKAYVQPGRTMPLHAAASAKAIFAFQDSGLVDRVLAEPRTKFTADTKIEDGEIRAELEQVSAESFAVCDNELDPGVLSYATPVRLEDGSVIYAIGISGLSERLRKHPRGEVRESLLNASKILSRSLQRTLARN
ncbi:MAG: IclR family transcriptional regulator [Alphaproteobacteria bacterium]